MILSGHHITVSRSPLGTAVATIDCRAVKLRKSGVFSFHAVDSSHPSHA